MEITRKNFLFQSVALMAPSLGTSAPLGLVGFDRAPSSGEVPPTLNVKQYGAKGDGRSKDTSAIQASIDAASRSGGMVYLPPGSYVSGTLHLKSLVTLFLAPGATLLASRDDKDFDPYEELGFKSYSDDETTYFHHALLHGEDIHHIAIIGEGIIDGNRTKRGGPKPIALKKCQQVSIRNITLMNAPNYNISMLGCDYVDIQGVTILNGFADGIDPDCSRHVRIANCYIESWDDCICPKSSFALGTIRSTENVTVTNCVLTTACNALKLGTESSGDFKNIVFSNCAVFGQHEKWNRRPMSGLAIESVDGSNIDGVVVSNIVTEGTRAAIFIRLGNRGRAQKSPTPGTIQNVSISGIVVRGASLASSITGIPQNPVSQVTLRNIHISATGGGTAEQADREIPEEITAYPDANMFGELPAYGVYCRHVQGLVLDGVHLRLKTTDERPALIIDDASDVDLLSFRADPVSGEQPVVLLRNTRAVLVQGAKPLSGTRTFLKLSGKRTAKVHALGNDLSDASLGFCLGEEVQKSALVEKGSLMPGPG